jgi:predicted MFS family arabinose efflux permease
MAIIPKFWVLYIAAVATGGGAGIAVIAFQRYVGRATTDTLELKKAFSWLTIGPAVSNFIGPLMTGLLIDHVSFAAAFTAIACLPMLCWLCIRHTPLLPVVICHKTSTTTSKSSAWDLMRNPAMQRLLLVNLLFSVSWELHTVVVPLFGHEQGYNASTIGTILGAFAVAAASVRVLLSLLAANLREWVILMIAMLATAILFGIYPLMPNAWAMGGCSVLLGLALGSVQPMILSALHYITPENRQGEALGLRSMTVNAAGVAMPMLLGVASVAVGVAGIFWSVAALMGLSAKLAKNLQHDIHVTQ